MIWPARPRMPWLVGERNTRRRPTRLPAAPSAVTIAAKSTTKFRKLSLLTAASNNPAMMSPSQEQARVRAKGPLRMQRNSVLAVGVHALYILATVCLFGSCGSAAREERATIGNNTAAIGAISMHRLPFLHGERETVGAAQPQEPRWVRVFSAKAAHPAMYVPGDGIVYCPIAKVACAEWRKTLRWMMGIPDWDTGPIHDQGRNGIPLLAGRRPREVELVMNDNNWLKFVVVRDPADRLLSGFLNKCVGAEWQNCPYMEFMPHRFEGVKMRDYYTDLKFLTAIDDEPREVFRDFMVGVQRDVLKRGCRVNSHWRPQYCFCSIARFLPFYNVIPFANMSTEAVKLVDHMQRPSPERADLLREFLLNRFSSNYDSKAQAATTKRDQYFSGESLDIVRQVYAKDYELFGTHFEEQSAEPL